jgi:hypothetical protein
MVAGVDRLVCKVISFGSTAADGACAAGTMVIKEGSAGTMALIAQRVN